MKTNSSPPPSLMLKTRTKSIKLQRRYHPLPLQYPLSLQPESTADFTLESEQQRLMDAVNELYNSYFSPDSIPIPPAQSVQALATKPAKKKRTTVSPSDTILAVAASKPLQRATRTTPEEQQSVLSLLLRQPPLPSPRKTRSSNPKIVRDDSVSPHTLCK